MATVMTCDGCGVPIPAGGTARYGRISPVDYCPTCTDTWRDWLADEAVYRTKMVADFEAWRARRLRALPIKGLPDD